MSVQKAGVSMTVSDEALEEGTRLAALLRSAMVHRREGTPPMLRWYDVPKHRARADQVRRYRQLVQSSDGLLRELLLLHKPSRVGYYPRVMCLGCDADGYEAENPEWPCSSAATALDGAR